MSPRRKNEGRRRRLTTDDFDPINNHITAKLNQLSFASESSNDTDEEKEDCEWPRRREKVN